MLLRDARVVVSAFPKRPKIRGKEREREREREKEREREEEEERERECERVHDRVKTKYNCSPS